MNDTTGFYELEPDMNGKYYLQHVHHALCIGIRYNSYIYEGHSEIIDTPWAFWTLGEIKNSAHTKVESFPLFQCWFKRPKEGFNLHCEHLIRIESQVDE